MGPHSQITNNPTTRPADIATTSPLGQRHRCGLRASAVPSRAASRWCRRININTRQSVILLHREPGARRLFGCAEPEMYVGAAHTRACRPSTNRRGVCSAVRTSHNDVPCNLGTTSGSAQAQRRRRRGPRSSAAPRAASLSQRTRLSVNSRPHSHIHRRHIKLSRFCGNCEGGIHRAIYTEGSSRGRRGVFFVYAKSNSV